MHAASHGAPVLHAQFCSSSVPNVSHPAWWLLHSHSSHRSYVASMPHALPPPEPEVLVLPAPPALLVLPAPPALLVLPVLPVLPGVPEVPVLPSLPVLPPLPSVPVPEAAQAASRAPPRM